MTRTDRLAALFVARPGEWIDGLELSKAGGADAWRTRLSELRRHPYSMDVENRQRRVERPGGTSIVISEYRLKPVTTKAGGSEEEATTAIVASEVQ
jgi:hypothetical protein